MDIQDLTKSERLLLDRRRADMTQRRAARAWSVSLYLYRRWEAGTTAPPDVDLGEVVEVHETCLIKRRRAGIKLKDLAKTLGCSRWWLCQMEDGRVNVRRLADYWGNRAA